MLRLLTSAALIWLLNVGLVVGSVLWLQFHPADGVKGSTWLCVALLHALLAVLLVWCYRKVLRWRRRREPRVTSQVKAERERIARDLHDGVGAHLFQALALLELPQCQVQHVRHSIENAMWCLRVEMQALDDVEASLLERLATMRWQLEPLLQGRSIAMQWSMPSQETDCSPSGERAMQLAMVAQEAISNALKHTDCQMLEISLQCDSPGQGVLRVVNQGPARASMQEAAHSRYGRGCGLRNMQWRAQRAQAHLEVCVSEAASGCVELSWR